MLTILSAEAPTGSGKTRSYAHLLKRQTDEGEISLSLQPTKGLIKQTAEQLKELDPNITIQIINGDTCDDGVVRRLAEHLNQPFDRPHVIFATESAFLNLPFLKNPSRYHIGCDEIPKCFKSNSVRVPNNHKCLTEAVSIEPQGISYGEVVIRDKTIIRKIADNKKGDAVDAVLQPFARIISNNNYRTFVDMKQYEDLRRGSLEDPHLRMFSLLRPETFQGFRSVRMMGARASETLLFKWFKRCGIRFEDDKEILEQLRYREHLNGELIDFYYGSETNWSLYAQEQDPNIRKVIVQGAIDCLNGRPFCWLDNKEFEADSPLNALEGNKRLPHASHGRNDFQHYDNVVIMTAFNPNPYDARFLEDFAGISWNEQKIAHDYHNTYQTLGRTSIRNPNNKNRKIVILPDRQNAEWQSQVFPGSSVQSLNVDYRNKKSPGRSKIYASSTERKQVSREKKKQEQELLVEKYDLCNQRILDAGYHMSCHDISYKCLRENVTTYQGSLVREKFEGQSFPLNMSNNDFGKYLNGLHKRRFEDKDDNDLIMPALCAPIEKSNTQRAFDNALLGRHVYLDIENGELKHRALSNIFPHIEIIAYNSYNHTPDKPRYRAIFLTDNVMAPNVYKFMWGQIVQRIENAGFVDSKNKRPKDERKLHGIDNKPNVVNTFYLPCQPKEGKGFYYHYSKGRQPLKVCDWIEHAIPTRFENDNPSEPIRINDVSQFIANQSEIIETALNKYRQAIHSVNPVTGKLGGSNEALFVLNKTLISADVDRWEREITLTQAANESRSPKDRLADKDRYMKRR